MALTLFSTIALLGGFLIFTILPLQGKILLPRFGPDSDVVQIVLLILGGSRLMAFVSVHFITFFAPIRIQLVVHLALVCVTTAVLFSISRGTLSEGDAVGLFALVIAILPTTAFPCFVLFASIPLMQRWFARTQSTTAADPYFLLCYTNLGGIAAVLAYPLLIEPNYTLAEQRLSWNCGYAGFAILSMMATFILWLGRADPSNIHHQGETTQVMPEDSPDVMVHVPTLRSRLSWFGLSLVAHSLAVAGQTLVLPLFPPLPLWGLSFTLLPLACVALAFMRWPFEWARAPHRVLWVATPFVLIAAIACGLVYRTHAGPISMLGIFYVSLVCFGELARQRPAVRYLTEFYLWILIGELTGGTLATMVAFWMEG